MSDNWVYSSPNSDLPAFAIAGGHDADATPIYVGRALHEGECLAAKVIPSKGCAYVAWGGQEHAKYEYELLTGPGYGWVPQSHGGISQNAVVTGYTNDGEPLYIGRGHHSGSLTVGKVHSSHGCLYIPFGGQEVRLSSYEVLVRQAVDTWLPASLEYAPHNCVVAGHDSDGTPIYVARCMHNGLMLPAKFVPDRREAYVGCDGTELHKSSVEVLIGQNYSWMQPHHNEIPPNAVFTGRSHSGEPLIIGRAHHNGSITPGLVSAGRDCVLIPYGGREVFVGNYEVLIRGGY